MVIARAPPSADRLARRRLAVGGLGSRLGLGSIPQLVEFGEGQVAQLDVPLAGHPLDAPETVAELLGRGAQRGLRLDAVVPGQVRHDQQQVADLLALLLGGRGRGQLGQLLLDLVEDADDLGPVVAEVGGPLLHLLGGGQRGHGRRDAVEGAADLGPGAARRPAASSSRSARLICSHWRLTSDGGLDLGVAEDVRVAADDLAADRLLDVRHVEDAGLGGELGVQNDLQVEVAELAGQIRRGSGVERVVDLVGLLEQVLLERGVGLLAIPRAAVRAGAAGRRSRAGPRGLPAARSGGSGGR